MKSYRMNHAEARAALHREYVKRQAELKKAENENTEIPKRFEKCQKEVCECTPVIEVKDTLETGETDLSENDLSIDDLDI